MLIPRVLHVLLTPLLAPLSWIYGFAYRIDRRRKSADAVDLDRPTISIGNLSTGGTGKTPVLLNLLRDLELRGKKVCVLTRGYQGIGSSSNGDSDEVLLMREQAPRATIEAGGDRVASARRAMATGPDIFILDDGFQHWRIRRQLDIICIDVSRPFAHDHLLPWGTLREPISEIKRAQVVLLTRTDQADSRVLASIGQLVRRWAPGAQILETWFAPQLRRTTGEPLPQTALMAQKVLAVSAIGNPRSFEVSLQKMGALVRPRRFLDHHHYSQADVNEMESTARDRDATLVCTEKDFVKLRSLNLDAARWRVLAIQLQFAAGHGEIWSRIVSQI